MLRVALLSYVAPGRQLRIRLLHVCEVMAAYVKAVQLAGQLGHPLVDPRRFIPVVRPVNHMLELVGQRAIVVGAIRLRVARVRGDEEHLALVRVLVNLLRVLVRGSEVARDIFAHVPGMEDVQPRVAVDAGRPFAAKELAVRGIGLFCEPFRRRFQITLVKPHADLDPHCHDIRHVLQFRRDLRVFLRVAVRHPELAAVAYLVLRRGVRHHFRDFAGVWLKLHRQETRIGRRHFAGRQHCQFIVFRLNLRLRGWGRRRSPRGDGGRCRWRGLGRSSRRHFGPGRSCRRSRGLRRRRNPRDNPRNHHIRLFLRGTHRQPEQHRAHAAHDRAPATNHHSRNDQHYQQSAVLTLHLITFPKLTEDPQRVSHLRSAHNAASTTASRMRRAAARPRHCCAPPRGSYPNRDNQRAGRRTYRS